MVVLHLMFGPGIQSPVFPSYRGTTTLLYRDQSGARGGSLPRLPHVTGGAQPAEFEWLVVVPHNDGVAESGIDLLHSITERRP
jgi:hypothetical protein